MTLISCVNWMFWYLKSRAIQIFFFIWKAKIINEFGKGARVYFNAVHFHIPIFGFGWVCGVFCCFLMLLLLFFKPSEWVISVGVNSKCLNVLSNRELGCFAVSKLLNCWRENMSEPTSFVLLEKWGDKGREVWNRWRKLTWSRLDGGASYIITR